MAKTKLRSAPKEQNIALNRQLDEGERVYATTRTPRESDQKHVINTKEDMLLEAIDQRRNIEKLIKMVESLESGKQDVIGALSDLSPSMLIQLAGMATNPKESSKVRLEAIKDWLDRAGFGKVNKHAIAPVDASTPREAVLALIAGKSKGADIEIVDDSEDSY